MTSLLEAAAGDLGWLGPPEVRAEALRAREAQRVASKENLRVIEGQSPGAWLGTWLAAVEARATHVLAAPSWNAEERASLVGLAAQTPLAGAILIPTGGTTGRPRLCVHTVETLSAAALGLATRLGGPLNSLCTLPLHHVSGLMQVVRAMVTGGRVELTDWKRLEHGALPVLPPVEGGWCLSLVPTQLARLVSRSDRAGWLRSFRCVFIGGAALPSEMAERARALGLPLAIAYGATETAAQATLLLPEAFLAGAGGPGRPLPHAELRIHAPDTEGVGLVEFRGESLFLGYAPDALRVGWWRTGDVGRLRPDGALELLGRADACINTGGEKVHPSLVEQAILEAGLADEALVVGLPDSEWGQVVAALVVGSAESLADARAELASMLPHFALPKVWRRVERLPLTPLGKPDRAAALGLLRSAEGDLRWA